MKPKMTNPAAVRARGALEMFSLAAKNSPENNPNPFDAQQFRAAWLARRAKIPVELAATLAPLAFGPEGAR